MVFDRMAVRRSRADQILALHPACGDVTRELVYMAKLRWRIERDYQELKQELGLGHYEGRGWRGFHHHATLAIAAYGFLISERGADRFPSATPGLPEGGASLRRLRVRWRSEPSTEFPATVTMTPTAVWRPLRATKRTALRIKSLDRAEEPASLCKSVVEKPPH